VFGSSARLTSPLARIPKVEPFVGKKLSAASAMPFGVPFGGTASKVAPATVAGFCGSDWVIVVAPAASEVVGTMAAEAAVAERPTTARRPATNTVVRRAGERLGGLLGRGGRPGESGDARAP